MHGGRSGARFDARANLCARRERHAALERFRTFTKIADECEEWLALQVYSHQTRIIQVVRGFDDGTLGYREKRGTLVRFAHREKGGGNAEVQYSLHSQQWSFSDCILHSELVKLEIYYHQRLL
jgi:hypothetical protein